MLDEELIYAQVYQIQWDEMVNVPHPRSRLSELPVSGVREAYIYPVPWRRILPPYTLGEVQQALDQKWYENAENDGTENRARQSTWFSRHRNLLAKPVVTAPDLP